MPLDLTLVGAEGEAQERSWTSTDAILYALGVGAGLADPLRELEFTTENSSGVEQRVLPTFGVLIGRGGLGRRLGDFDPAFLVHAEQGLTLHSPIPVEGRVRTTAKVTGIYDKGSGALVVTDATAVSADTGRPLVTSRSAAFIRGEGGFGGERGPGSDWARPEGAPDLQIEYTTRPEQALLYRLSGDRNPLHSDPSFAARGGFGRPILHGLCTYGFTGRALLHGLCDSDPARFGSMQVRFTKPVLPGETLIIAIWPHEGGARFQTSTETGGVVLDHGVFEFAQGV